MKGTIASERLIRFVQATEAQHAAIDSILGGGLAADSQALAIPLHYLDKAAMAKHMGISVRLLEKLTANGTVPYHKFGQLVRFAPVDVAVALEARTRVCRRTKRRS